MAEAQNIVISSANDFTPTARVLKQMLWTLCIYTLIRIIFASWNFSIWYSKVAATDFLTAFVEGIRFDLAIITILSSLVLIFSLIPWPSVSLRLKSWTLTAAMALIHSPLLIPNIADAEFIHFIGRRFSSDSFFLASEIPGKFFALVSTYWPLALLMVFILVFYVLGLVKLGQTQMRWNPFEKVPKRIATSLIILILAIIAGRGGFQLKPIELAHAMTYQDSRISNLVLNSSFTLAYTSKSFQLKTLNTIADANILQSNLNQNLPGVSLLKVRPKNVVLIILESFSYEYLGFPFNGSGYTPFLDELSSQSIVYNLAFANGRRSIESLPSIFLGLPSMMTEAFVTSRYQDIQTPNIPLALENAGVKTAFFHGGKNGTMFFDQFTKRIGFSEYFGANEYPNSNDQDGIWGIWDEPFFQFAAQKMSEFKTPFFSTIFSLSSHHPFQVPTQYQGTFPKGDLDIHQTIGYTDLALKRFFETAEKTNWYQDTLFIITADHTSRSSREGFQNLPGQFRIPMILFWPSGIWPEGLPTDQPVQQADLASTLTDLFQLNTPTFKFSRSLFTEGDRSVMLYQDGIDYLLFQKKALSSNPSTKAVHYYNIENYGIRADSLIELQEDAVSVETKNELNLKLNSSRQYYNNSLIQNRF